MSQVTQVNQMGPGTLVRTPVPCARVMMTLASRGKLPQININITITINMAPLKRLIGSFTFFYIELDSRRPPGGPPEPSGRPSRGPPGALPAPPATSRPPPGPPRASGSTKMPPFFICVLAKPAEKPYSLRAQKIKVLTAKPCGTSRKRPSKS